MRWDLPRALIFSGVNAGTIFENIRHGKVIFYWRLLVTSHWYWILEHSRTIIICPAPLAALRGNISAFVMAKPKDAVRILCQEFRLTIKTWISTNNIGTDRRISGRIDIHIKEPRDNMAAVAATAKKSMFDHLIIYPTRADSTYGTERPMAI